MMAGMLIGSMDSSSLWPSINPALVRAYHGSWHAMLIPNSVKVQQMFFSFHVIIGGGNLP